MTFEPVIGLEIHAQLQTRTKIFCGCSTSFGAPPNSHVCPVCLGMPGALPVLNRAAVDYAIKAALALGCDIQPLSIFARKNYFYPDLPKGYQISQYDRPLATDGSIAFRSSGREVSVGVIRVHLEEDAGKSLHDGLPDSSRSTYLDFNRSGVPLIEIVTHPDLRSAADADGTAVRGEGDLPSCRERAVVLRDLIALRQVRIEIILAREHAAAVDRAADREAEADRALDGAAVQDRQHARQCNVDRGGMRIRRGAECGRCTGEDL